jgi:hypothetical protein
LSLIFYQMRPLFRRYGDLPGMAAFWGIFRAYGVTVMPLDRTGTIKFPVRARSLFPLPAMTACTKSYEQICNERALELLQRAETLDVPLYTFWSGGIDSTCVLVSLLKQSIARDRIHVLMSEASISEYPEFYRQHIRGKLRCLPAHQFPYLVGTKNLLVSGEHNDQLFGSDIIADAIKRCGFDDVMAPYNRALMIRFYSERMTDQADAVQFVNSFERLKERAPVPLKTNYDLLWWINFTVKWQTVFMRLLSYVAPRNIHGLTADYVKDYYTTFYGTNDFQLWSMNNLDKRVRDSWNTYKWPAKNLIYDFTKDADYRDSKLKFGSVMFLLVLQSRAAFIDDGFHFHDSVGADEFYEPHNDFAEQRWN